MQLESPKRLKRSCKERMLAGVCGGIAEYMNVDPTIIRLVFASASIFTAIFPGVLIYLIMWAVVPKDRY